jgi:hypothetical protein
MIFYKLNDLLVYFLTLVVLELILLTLSLIFRQFFKRLRISKMHIFLTILFLTISEFLIFKVDWDFVGENKDGIIPSKGFIFLLVVSTVISIILLIIAIGIEKLINWRKNAP